MNRAYRSLLLALLCALAGWGLSRAGGKAPVPLSPAPSAQSAPATAPAPTAAVSPSTTTASPPGARSSGLGFRSPARLADHFEKHGQEFGARSPEEYLQMAQALRDAPLSATVLEIVRPTDGVISRFDTRSGAFLAVDTDGIIRTFFRPNDGEAYFRRQSRRSPRP